MAGSCRAPAESTAFLLTPVPMTSDPVGCRVRSHLLGVGAPPPVRRPRFCAEMSVVPGIGGRHEHREASWEP